MKRKLVSGFLATVLAASLLAGCGGDGKGNNDGASSNGGGDSQTGEGGGEEASSDINMDEEPYTVAIQVVTLPGTEFEGEEEREAAINAITEPAINCKVDIQEVWISEIANTTSMAIAGGEKVDLIHVATVSPLSSMVGSDMLYDMNTDNLLQNRGSKLVELFGETLESGNVKGRQLAVPAKTFSATAKGIGYNKTIADQLGITIPEKITMEQLDEILHQVHEKNPDIMPFYSGNGENILLYWMQAYESFGTSAAYGAVFDAANNPKVENFFASDMYKNFCLMMQRWKAEGIQPGDPTDTNTSQDYFNAQKLFCAVISINPEQKVMWSSQAASNGFEVGYAEMVDPVQNNSTVTEYMWGIASNSERPDKAMDFLNFLYSNAEVANILQYGIEGTNYTFAEGSDKVIEANGSYLPMFYYGGDSHDMLIKAPAGEDYVEQLDALEKSATVSPLCGYMFDDSGVQTEAAVIGATITEYTPRLANGMAGSEEETLALIDEFNAKLEASGINDVIAENQKQLEEYLAGQQ